MRPRTLMLFAGLLIAGLPGHGQAPPAATGGVTLEAGVGGTIAFPDYSTKMLDGISAFATANFSHHLGLELDYHYLDIITPDDIGEVTYLGGVRYHTGYGRFHPYLKGMVGIGSFREHVGYFQQESSSTHKVVAIGGGLELPLTRHINLRAVDAEYQYWPNFANGALTPFVLTTGVAYRF